MRPFVANRDQEPVHSLVDSLGVQVGKHNCHSSSLRKVSDPELHRRLGRRVDHKLVCLRVEVRSCFEFADVRAMAELSQSKAPHLFKRGCLSERVFVNLSAEVLDRLCVESELNCKLGCDSCASVQSDLHRAPVDEVDVVDHLFDRKDFALD